MGWRAKGCGLTDRKSIIVGAIAALAFGGTYAFMCVAPVCSAQSHCWKAAPKIDVEQVLVAGQDLPMGTVVNQGEAVWHPWPKADVSELMITKSTKPGALKYVDFAMTRMPSCAANRSVMTSSSRPGMAGSYRRSCRAVTRAVAIKTDNNGDFSAVNFILPGRPCRCRPACA